MAPDIKEDALYQLGEQKGKEEGKEEAALNMLPKGMAVELISEITELAAENITQLRQQLEAGS